MSRGNGTAKRVQWDRYLDQRRHMERVALMPVELQRALATLIDAFASAAEASFSPLPGRDENDDIGVKVQTNHWGSKDGIHVTNKPIAEQLERRYPRKLEHMAAEVRSALAFEGR